MHATPKEKCINYKSGYAKIFNNIVTLLDLFEVDQLLELHSSYNRYRLSCPSIWSRCSRIQRRPDTAPYQIWRLQPKLPNIYIRPLSHPLTVVSQSSCSEQLQLTRCNWLSSLAWTAHFEYMAWRDCSLFGVVLKLVINWTLNKLRVLIQITVVFILMMNERYSLGFSKVYRC